MWTLPYGLAFITAIIFSNPLRSAAEGPNPNVISGGQIPVACQEAIAATAYNANITFVCFTNPSAEPKICPLLLKAYAALESSASVPCEFSLSRSDLYLTSEIELNVLAAWKNRFYGSGCVNFDSKYVLLFNGHHNYGLLMINLLMLWRRLFDNEFPLLIGRSQWTCDIQRQKRNLR